VQMLGGYVRLAATALRRHSLNAEDRYGGLGVLRLRIG
jgi:hypothetical protein